MVKWDFKVGDTVCWQDTPRAQDYKRGHHCPDRFVIADIVDTSYSYAFALWDTGVRACPGAGLRHLQLVDGPW